MLAKEADAQPTSKTEIKAYIDHHLEDAHDFTLLSYTAKDGHKVHVGIPLPVILLDNGLKIFSSSKLHHGESVAKVGDSYYKLDHGKIYRVDAEGTITYDAEHHATNVAPLIFQSQKMCFYFTDSTHYVFPLQRTGKIIC